jgi:hypothetical protein
MKKLRLMIPGALLMIFLLFSTPGLSQRVNFQNIKCNFIHLPLYPLNPDYKTYNPTIKHDKIPKSNLRTLDDLAERIHDMEKRYEANKQN